jgi:predicted HTH transcriptional regulator
MLQVENELIEYKEKLTDTLEKEAVAFLNANGGCIYIGVKDNGNVVGVSDIDKTQLQIKDRLIFGISPSVLSSVSIGTETLENKTVLKIAVKEGTEKPYYIKKKGLSESGAFIRVGSSAQPMTSEMIHAFQTKSFPKSLVNIESPEQELTFADLFIHYRRYNKPLNDDTFAKTLNFLTKDGKYNYLAYIMADNNQLSVRFARFNDAGERFELIEKAVEYGDCCLVTAIQRILDRYEIENITLSKLTGAAHRIDKRLADRQCLREVVINAFAHNDYSYGMLPIFEVFQNRFAIRSYGGLVPQLSVEEFFKGVSALRNPELMRILKDLELVEALGFGIRGITKIYSRDVFEFSENSLYVTLAFGEEITKGRGISRGKGRGISRGKILELITENPQISIPEIAETIGLSIKSVEKNIRQLKKDGKMIRTTNTKNGKWVVIK